MFIIITLSILLITALSLGVVRIFRPAFAWPVAAVGALLAWISTFLWMLNMPVSTVISVWQPAAIFTYSPTLIADKINYPYALGLVSLALAIIFASAENAATANPFAWLGTFLLTTLSLFAVMAGNPLTLVMAWAMLDVVELVNILRIVNDPKASESAVVAFALRITGTIIIMWAASSSFSSGGPLSFTSMPAQVGLYLLIATGIRLSTQLYNLPYSNENALARGYSPALRLVSAAATLILPARLPAGTFSPLTATLLTLVAAVVGLVAIFNFLRATDMTSGRPHWIIALAMLSIAAGLRGNPTGSAAWGSALIFSGSILFLFVLKNRWLVIALLAAAIFMSGLPFSLTASGWMAGDNISWLPLIVLLPLQAMIVAAYIRSIAKRNIEDLEHQPAWVRAFYPAGLLVPGISALALGFTGWDGALVIGNWGSALVASLLTAGLTWLLLRIPVPEPPPLAERMVRRPAALLTWLSNMIWALYRTLGRLSSLLARTLEGDGGFLWTILLLVLLISVLQGNTR